MRRNEVIDLIDEKYNVKPEGLWEKYPNYYVFRHGHNRKWFAILMDAPNKTLGLDDKGTIDVLNVKLEKNQVDELLSNHVKGFLPAYHMNKSTWISAVIEELSDEQIEKLIEASFQDTQS